MTPCNGARFRLPSGDGVGVFDKWSGQEAPVSRSFPLGARAVMASSGGGRFVRAADGQACVEFLAPDFIEAMVTEVGRVIPAGGRHAALTGGEASRGGKGPFNAPPVFHGQRGSKHRSCSDVQQRRFLRTLAGGHCVRRLVVLRNREAHVTEIFGPSAPSRRPSGRDCSASEAPHGRISPLDNPAPRRPLRHRSMGAAEREVEREHADIWMR
jgi:hypothetical protein